jgi:N-carbamoyl-L-amino-acid hydrolase
MLSINRERFKENFSALANIGVMREGGINRPTFSNGHFKAREWFKQKTIDAGFKFKVDNAGNHIARFNCPSSTSPVLIIGSHLDSVPNGGKYDGALGVVAALEVLQTVKDSGVILPYHLEAIDFTDEEGTLVGLLGSSAVAGKLSEMEIANPRGNQDVLVDGYTKLGLSPSTILTSKRAPESIAGYIELHIEQGKILYEENIQVGIVTKIVGINSCSVTFLGRADHAGTTKMEDRLDASQGASSFGLTLFNRIKNNYPACVVNIGKMVFHPGAFNIVPEKVVVSVEFRAPESRQLDEIKFDLITVAKESAKAYNLKVEINFLGKHPPVIMDPRVRSTIKRVADSLGLKSREMPSGAGHDSQSFARICPSGMIFIPSKGGISHSPKEFSYWKDCVNGANVLLNTVLQGADYVQLY